MGRFIDPASPLFDSAGVPLSGGKLYFYATGTTTPQNTWSDKALTVLNANPILLNSAGRPVAEIWLSPALYYKVAVTTSADVPVYTRDPVDSTPDLANTTDTALGDALVGVKNILAGGVARTQHQKNADLVNLKDFGAKFDGVTNDRAAIQSALDSGEDLLIPRGLGLIDGPLVMRTSRQRLAGMGWGSQIRLTSTNGVLCAIAIKAGVLYPLLEDFELQGSAVSEPVGGAGLLTAIVVGTNDAGTLQDNMLWDGAARLRNLHITGATPGTSGFNTAVKFNRCRYSEMTSCLVDSLYGKASGFGYGVLCNASDTLISNCIFNSSIAGQGRHAVYFSDTPSRSSAVKCFAKGFQAEAFTTSMTSEGNDIHFIECIALDCMATETGAQSGAFAFFGGARGKIIRCKVLGNSKGSNHHGVSVRNCIETVIDDLYTQNIYRIPVYIENSHNTFAGKLRLNEYSVESPGVYGGVFIRTSDRVKVSGVLATVSNARSVVTLDLSTPFPANCLIEDIAGTGMFAVGLLENAGYGVSNQWALRNGVTSFNASTPNVSGLKMLVDAVTGATNVSNMSGGIDGQTMTILFTSSYLTFVNSTTMKLAGAANFAGSNLDTFTLIFYNGVWYEKARRVN